MKLGTSIPHHRPLIEDSFHHRWPLPAVVTKTHVPDFMDMENAAALPTRRAETVVASFMVVLGSICIFMYVDVCIYVCINYVMKVTNDKLLLRETSYETNKAYQKISVFGAFVKYHTISL